MEDILKDQIDTCDWQTLIPSFVRGIVVVIQPHIAFIEAATAIATDDAKKVKQWLESGAIANATDENHMQWLKQPNKQFHMVIVSPYVLIQEIVPIEN